MATDQVAVPLHFHGHDGPIAQRLEQRTHNPLVPGSSPGGPTKMKSEAVQQSPGST